MARTEKVILQGSLGHSLAAKIDFPDGEPKAFGIFAHCFTCSKDFLATSRLSKKLAEYGFAIFRFDFTGLGESQGKFAETNFSTNIKDILLAADFLKRNYEAPQMLVGHSLGGAAVLFAAPDIPEVKAVATINAPCDPRHVQHQFAHLIDEINEQGQAEFKIADRSFILKKHFLQDLSQQKTDAKLEKLKAALLVCHAPADVTVGIEQAAHIFMAAKHPKSFVSLDTADHLLTDREDSNYVASVINAWSSRYLESS